MDGAAPYEINESFFKSLSEYLFKLNIFCTFFHCHLFDLSYFMTQGVYRDKNLPKIMNSCKAIMDFEILLIFLYTFPYNDILQ